MNELNQKLSQFLWLWRKRKHRRYAYEGPLADTASGQGRILALLKVQDNVSTKDMASLFGVHSSTVNDVLGKLEKGGYIVRVPSEHDKRVFVVRLTDKGKTVELPSNNADGDAFSAVFNSAEQKDFCGYLDRIIGALQKELGIDGAEMQERIKDWEKRKNG